MRNSIIRLTHALAVMFLMAIGIVQQASAGEIIYTLDLSDTELTIDSVVAPDGNTYTRIYTADCDFIGEPGEPMIPAKIINFLVPTYSNNFKVSITSSKSVERRMLSRPLIPVQEDQLTSEYDPMKFTAPIRSPKSESSRNSTEIANELFVNGDSHVVSVAVPMISYNFSPLGIDLLSNLEISLEYSECSPSQMYLRPISGPESVLDMNLEGFVVNPPSTKAKNAGAVRTDNNSRYLILTPQSLKESVTELARWKTQRGHKVTVRTVEEIMANSTYDFVDGTTAVDKESKIRNWLKHEVKGDGLFQLLIVGDYRTSAPIRKFNMGEYNSNDSIKSKYDSEAFMPSDGYFSDLNSPFPLSTLDDGNKYIDFYSIKNRNFSPTLPVGRLTANKQGDIDNYLRKLLIYQIDPGLGNTEYLSNALLTKQYDMYHYTWRGGPYQSMFDSIRGDYNVIMLIDSLGNNKFELNEPTGKEVIDNLRLCSLASIQGHGIPCSISCSGSHHPYTEDRYILALPSSPITKWGDYTHVEKGNTFADLNNFGQPSIVYTRACASTPYDNPLCGFGHVDVDYVMGSAFLCAGDFGGAAYIGYVRDGGSGTNVVTEHLFGAALNKNHNIGNASVNAIRTSKFAQASNNLNRHLIGDPDIDVWIGSPSRSQFDIRVNLPSATFNGELSGSTIAFYDGNQNSSTMIFPSDFLSKNVTFRIPDYITSRQKDFAISVFKDGELPTIKLFASDSKLKNNTRYYFLREGGVTRQNGTYGFILQDKGILNLTCTRSLYTDHSFKVESGGTVNVKCFGNVALKEDVVNAGGKINVNAAETTLVNGFSLEKGGELSITTHKWNGYEPSE